MDQKHKFMNTKRQGIYQACFVNFLRPDFMALSNLEERYIEINR